MTDWVFDEPAFVEEVLKPVQDGWQPERNYFRVYQLPLSTDDKAKVDTALEGVRRKLNSPRFRGYQRACDLLRSQHEAAAAVLKDDPQRRAHRQEVRAELVKLRSGLQHRLNGAPGLSPTEVAELARESRGVHTRSAIRLTLTELNVRELDPVELPPATQPGQWQELRARLNQLRFDSLWDYLTTKLAGPATTLNQVTDRRAQLRVSRDESTTAETTVLKFVEQWIRADLAAVLRYELVSTLQSEVKYGYPELESTTCTFADRLSAMGLPAEPATVAYAVWCTSKTRASRGQSWEDAYQSAMRSRQLRAALDVLTAQPGLSAEWQQQRDQLRTRLVALDADLDRAKALERTDVEAAVELYHQVRSQLDDPAIEVALERCRPAPPRHVKTNVGGRQVTVTWQPSPAIVGRICYRVMRANQGVPVEIAAEITALECVDLDPEGGIPLTYSVFTMRDGVPSRKAAVSAPVTVLREVEQVQIEGRPDCVSGRWQLPARASGVAVKRTKDGVTQPVSDVHRTGFVDRQVKSGITYTYRVCAEYRLPNGSVVYTDGVVMSAARQELPVAVTDLRVDVDDDEFLVRWTPPARGEVEILELSGDSMPGSGVVPVKTAMKHGQVLRTTGVRTNGQVRARPRSEHRKHVLIPVTVLGELAAVGTACEVDTRQSPVRSLHAERFGPTVRLTWAWPAGVSEARVIWRASQAPLGPHDPEASTMDVTRAGYDSRGVHITAAAGDHWFGVCTSVPDDGQTLYGPLALVRESAVTEVRYSVRRLRFRSKGLRELVIEGDEPPPVVLVAKTGTRPMNVDDGEPIVRLPADSPAARTEFTVPAHLRRPVHLRAFSLDDQVVLVPTRLDHLIVT